MKTIYRTINGIRLSSVQMQILTLLRSAGGEARVGEVAASRPATIRALESMEKAGLVRAVIRPVPRAKVAHLGERFPPAPEKCGTWALTDFGRETVGKLDDKNKRSRNEIVTD
jgi:hypothetical protein